MMDTGVPADSVGASALGLGFLVSEVVFANPNYLVVHRL